MPLRVVRRVVVWHGIHGTPNSQSEKVIDEKLLRLPKRHKKLFHFPGSIVFFSYLYRILPSVRHQPFVEVYESLEEVNENINNLVRTPPSQVSTGKKMHSPVNIQRLS